MLPLQNARSLRLQHLVEQVEERARGSDLRIDKNALKFPFQINDDWTLVYVLYSVNVENSGPEQAIDITVDDELRLEGLTDLGTVVVLDNPVVGGQIVDIAYEDVVLGVPTSASFQIEMGDLMAGDQKQALFWAAVVVHRTGALLTNRAAVGAAGGEPTPLNNIIQIGTPIP